MPRPVLIVAGSLNMDFVCQVAALPQPGATVLGSGFQMLPGGKGANQAYAAGRLGGEGLLTRMIGRVGADVFANQLRASLASAGVDTAGIGVAEAAATGIAMIWVEPGGQNSIVVAPGANAAIEPRDVEAWREAFTDARWALFQLETPLPVVAEGLRLALQRGCSTMLDPAPAQPLSGEMLRMVSILTPNETEASRLLGRPAVGRVAPGQAHELTTALRALGARAVTLKLGDAGCFYDDGAQQYHVPAFPVEAVDATAAGDTFNGAFAVALAEGKPVDQALRFASAAAAISVTRRGAQASIPERAEVDRFLARHGTL